ncbi:hypothetical protein GOBAR_AA32849 [Gossypium barbadense]|uniref:Uncharacterized protein n=1 Tax=Gossypium barbadense TaxID=3634 RepID=A0A2P5W9R2_GOSBA|nr:hypothetical protein GOBAR_AA32849 [Gossypium barbadense]
MLDSLMSIICQDNDESGGGYSGGGGRAGLGIRGEPSPLELQVPNFALGHVTPSWRLIASLVGENFLPYFHTAMFPPMVCAQPKARQCAWPCGWENPVFQDSVSRLDVKN